MTKENFMHNPRRPSALFPKSAQEAADAGRPAAASMVAQLGGVMGRTLSALPLMDLAVVMGILLILAR